MRERPAARVLVLTPERRVLLMRFRFPWRDADLWITPGGALEHGEEARDAAMREIREETGFQVTDVGPELWTRDHDLSSFGMQILQRERYFLVQVEEFVPQPDSLQEGEEATWFRGFRWWPIEELPDVAEDIAPRTLGKLVRELVRTGPPEKPFAIGV